MNLRVVDEWHPGNEQHQHSESDMGKDSTKIRIETYLHSISTNIISADDFVSRRGHLLYHKFCQSKNHRRPCIRIRVGRVAFRWQIRWTSANNLHLIMPPSPSFYGERSENLCPAPAKSLTSCADSSSLVSMSDVRVFK